VAAAQVGRGQQVRTAGGHHLVQPAPEGLGVPFGAFTGDEVRPVGDGDGCTRSWPPAVRTC